ncbi:disease resistance protein RPS2-like [Zingiber officinale]|uniref:disease resistance protein RPS2-like n=1 Tax=Zingiber officinale TaxID=94328 RepID=UPI001C4C1634|nr:disease resistance protein RPS2-like [Zingiber officinale]
MNANEKKKLANLASDPAWELFLKYAGKDVINSEPGINQLAREIVKECAGLLALITVGRAMSAKRSWDSWNDALMQLRPSQMPEVTKLVDSEHTVGIKMHDVIRDMDLWMVSDCGSNQYRLPFPQTFHAHAPTEPYATLNSWDIFQALLVLAFLELSGTDIAELSREIKMLSELQHLNLNFTPIVTVPTELSSLAKLEYLLLVGTERLIKVPMGTLSNLPLLKLLDSYESKYANLNELEEFQGRQKYIGITLDSKATLERLGSLPLLSIWKLQLQDMRDLACPSQLFERIMRSDNIRQGLERLEIVDAMIDDELIVTGNNKDIEKGFECLRYMALTTVNNLQEITWGAVKPQTLFPILHELNISGCKMLRNITWALQLPNHSIFSSFMVLSVHYVYNANVICKIRYSNNN